MSYVNCGEVSEIVIEPDGTVWVRCSTCSRRHETDPVSDEDGRRTVRMRRRVTVTDVPLGARLPL